MVWIPNSVKDVFTNEVQIPEDNDIATTENVAHVAMLLFVGYIDAATSMSESCGGGGSSPSSGWGKKKEKMIGVCPPLRTDGAFQVQAKATQ
ncbi:hypothetical protein [Segatella copri]|uniref:hypothetical protein n=1 Tax=Segatella copri TaxID=165179 RepID=UPI00294AF2D3|nr:hypothetical protein [Segatella copri]WOG31050.1 hypothetical protein RJT04_11690 [Segatella copri]